MSKLLKSELQLSSVGVTLSADDVICIGCFNTFNRMHCQTGRLYQGLSFKEVPKFETELTYDHKGKLVKEEEIATLINRPIHRWAKGYMCGKCPATLNYGNVEHIRKSGEVWHEPKVQLDTQYVWVRNKQGKEVRKPTYSVSLNPGWSRSEEIGEDINPTYKETSELWAPRVKTQDEITGKSYNMTITKPRNGFQQTVLREKVDERKKQLLLNKRRANWTRGKHGGVTT